MTTFHVDCDSQPCVSHSLENPLNLRAIGFCGADDSVSPFMIVVLAVAYPNIEFGVLFRPDKEGTPRYASTEWVKKLSHACRRADMKLAAHLCGSRVNDILRGEQTFVCQLQQWKFKRVQINATAVNGVDTSRLHQAVEPLKDVIMAFPDMEFIIQKNQETEPLWQGMIDKGIPKNVAMLVDESKGTGVSATSWPAPPKDYEIGYAGGIGPDNVSQVLSDIQKAANGRPIWIDMESSLRSIKNGRDVFDLDKCYHVIEMACDLGVLRHPNYITKP